MTELREPQPYEILKAGVDEAREDFVAKLNAIMHNVNHKDGPLLLLIDIENLFASYAVLESRTDAFMREYAHMTEINEQVKVQRDEIKRKFETFRRTLNQLNLEDGDQNPQSKPAKSSRRKK